MNIIARLREVAPREFVRRNEREHVRVDGWAQRFDRVPHKRVAPFLVRVKVSDRQREPLCRERLGEASGLYDVAIIEHGVDRVRGVLRPEESVAFAAPGEAHPRPWQIAGLSLSQARVFKAAPIGYGGAALYDHDLGDASRSA